MSNFFSRPIDRIGATLRQRREELGATTRDIAGRLRIPSQYIEAFEEHRYCDIPAAFLKPWLRSYITALGLGWETAGASAIRAWEREQERAPLRSMEPSDVTVAFGTHSRARRVAVIGCILGFLYIAVMIAQSLLPPPLGIIGIPRVSETRVRHMNLTLESAAGVSGTLNGMNFQTDGKGVARLGVDLQAGVNTLVLRAARTHSRARVVEYTVVVKE